MAATGAPHPYPSDSSPEEMTMLVIIAAGVIACISFLIIFVSNKKCWIWALAVLVLILGYLAYLGHHEHVKKFADRATALLEPVVNEIKGSHSAMVNRNRAAMEVSDMKALTS